MRATGLVLTAAVAAALLIAAPAQARDPHPKCNPKGSQGLANGGRVRVFRVARPSAVDDSEASRVYACDQLTGRRTVVAYEDLPDQSFGIVQARYAGTVVGMHVRYCGSRYGCEDLMLSLDVVTRRVVRVSIREATPPHVPFVVAPSGSIAWIQFGRVERARADGARELDAGPGAEALALAPNGRLYWTRGGAPRSAELDPVAEPSELPPDPAFGGSRRCYERRSKALGSGPRARVYERTAVENSQERRELVACNLRSGRRTAFRVVDPATETYEVEHLRTAGWFVAAAARGCVRAVCGAAEIQTVDLRSGTIRYVNPNTGGLGATRTTDLQLLPDGGVAWIFEAGDTRSVHVCGPASCVMTERSSGVEPGSLALAPDGRAYWTGAGGLPRSAARP